LIPADFNKEIFNFIKCNEKTDPFELSLRLKHFPPDIRKFISIQIQSRQKLKKKVPEWLNFNQIILPEPISIEQASSKLTACYKSEFVNGGTLIDLTGGLGVDTFFFAGKVDKVIYIERDSEIASIAEYNFSLMGMQNIQVICQSAEAFLKEFINTVDYFYMDPSRRLKERRMFKLEDSEPNLIEIQDKLLNNSKFVITKAAPYIDLQYAIKKVNSLKEIHIVAVDNECKEIVLLSTSSNHKRDIKIITANHNGSIFEKYTSTVSSEYKSKCKIANFGRYIYDPNVAIRKAGLFRSLCQDFDLSKPANNSHIYFSDNLLPDFPGRVFELIDHVPANIFMKNPPVKRANIAVRNFPLKVAEIRKRTKIQEGGEVYIFGTTDQNEHHYYIICQKVSNKKVY
jgi:hypothetical protein